MTACLINPVFICIFCNILCFFLQRGFSVSHSNGHPFLPKHGAIIHTVTEYDNLLICQMILFHNFKNAPLFMHRFYQQRIFPEPYGRQTVERYFLRLLPRTGDKYFIDLLRLTIIIAGNDIRFIVAVLDFFQILRSTCNPVFPVLRRYRPRMFFPILSAKRR